MRCNMGMAKLQHQNKVRNCMFVKVTEDVVSGKHLDVKKTILHKFGSYCKTVKLKLLKKDENKL